MLERDPRPSPDPLLSANIYCSGLLDELLVRALLPFWQALRRTERADRCLLWTIRYGRRGEHLKVRLHGDPEDADFLKQSLTEHVEGYLETVRDSLPGTPRAGGSGAPPIDPEDEAPGELADRSLLWTTYRRSYVSLVGSPWIEDDAFVAHATKCLARGCELVLAAVEKAEWSPAARQKLLIKALLSGLGALGLGELERAAGYLRYHRDWLLRFFLDEERKEQEILEHFRQLTGRMAAMIEQLRRVAQEQWAGRGEGGELDPWQRALTDLACYIGSFRGREGYQVDPFTSDVTFPPIFKTFHGLANQIGLVPLDEAYVHHLLLAAVAPPVAVEPALALEGRTR